MKTTQLLILELALTTCWVGGAPTAAQADTRLSYSQTEDYLTKRSNGAITGTPGDWNDLEFIPNKSERYGKILMPPKLEYDKIFRSQDAFAIDVEKFTKQMEASDFLEAKFGYYQQLEFNVERQLHERPYYYPYSWGQLFHPPIKTFSLPLEKYSKLFPTQDLKTRTSIYFDPEFQDDIDSLTDTQLSFGNELKMLPDGSAWAEKLRLIREAKHSILTASLVYGCEPSTRILLDAMIEAKEKRGVDIRVMVEGITNMLDFGCVEAMQRHGFDVLIISDIFKAGSKFGVMHHKLWIRDNEEAILGGQNVIDAENLSNGFNFRNRDTDVLLRKGPLVTDLAREYIETWNNRYRPGTNQPITAYDQQIKNRYDEEMATGQRGRKHYKEILSDPERRMKGVCRLAVQPSGADYQPISPILYAYIEGAKDSVFMNSPTVDFGDSPIGQEKRDWNDILKDLMVRKATQDDVKFQIVSNGFDGGNGELTIKFREFYHRFQSSGNGLLASFFKRLMYWSQLDITKAMRASFLKLNREKNIDVWQYFGYDHAKTYIFDRLAVSVGSWNFDVHSSERSYETQLFCLDEKLLQEQEFLFLRDIVNSIPVTSLFGK